MELRKLQEIVAKILGIDKDEILSGTTFVEDLGADSLDIYQIILAVEQEFDIRIEPERMERVVTVEDALELIKSATRD